MSIKDVSVDIIFVYGGQSGTVSNIGKEVEEFFDATNEWSCLLQPYS